MWGVHVTNRRDPNGDTITGPIEFIASKKKRAEEYAAERSMDDEVQFAAVTSYIVDEPGRRTRVALYVNGKDQQRPYCVDGSHAWARG